MDHDDEGSTKPLTRLLQGVSGHVFAKPPATVGARTLQRDMAAVLRKLRDDDQYAVLTMRGVPAFLLVPVDQNAWSSLLAATAPDLTYEANAVAKAEAAGQGLRSADEVLAAPGGHQAIQPPQPPPPMAAPMTPQR